MPIVNLISEKSDAPRIEESGRDIDVLATPEAHMPPLVQVERGQNLLGISSSKKRGAPGAPLSH
jgi:hypothetical protein